MTCRRLILICTVVITACFSHCLLAFVSNFLVFDEYFLASLQITSNIIRNFSAQPRSRQTLPGTSLLRRDQVAIRRGLVGPDQYHLAVAGGCVAVQDCLIVAGIKAGHPPVLAFVLVELRACYLISNSLSIAAICASTMPKQFNSPQRVKARCFT